MPFKVANVIRRFNSGSGGTPRTVALIAQAGGGLWRAELFTTDYVEAAEDTLLLSDFPGYVNVLAASAQTSVGGALMSLGLSTAYRAQLVRAARPDVVHLHGIWNHYLGAYAAEARRNGIPYIVASHGLLEPGSLKRHSWRKALALRTYQGHILRGAAALHVASESEARHMRRLGYTNIPIFVIPNPVDDPGNIVAAAIHSTPEDQVLLFMSSLHERKGLDILLNSWNALRPDGWELLVVGSGSRGYSESLQRYCRERRVPRIRFCEEVEGEEREAMFARASAFVLPAYGESIGNAVGDALARGLPVITTTSTPWSVIREQRLGSYIAPSADPLRHALTELFAAKPATLRAMGERGRAYARENLLVATIRPRLLQMYLSTLRH
jgi:glycosyltransferase involved in cell wall biosynthesis